MKLQNQKEGFPVDDDRFCDIHQMYKNIETLNQPIK